jgi:hypothetical protein
VARDQQDDAGRHQREADERGAAGTLAEDGDAAQRGGGGLGQGQRAGGGDADAGEAPGEQDVPHGDRHDAEVGDHEQAPGR